jgi:glutamyl-tRNA synthetase
LILRQAQDEGARAAATADGSFLYTLLSVVDDIDFGVTQVIRGDDHVTNTGAQIALFEALGGSAPAFGHHDLLLAETVRWW